MAHFDVEASIEKLKRGKLMLKEQLDPTNPMAMTQYEAMDVQIEFARWALTQMNKLDEDADVTDLLRQVGVLFGSMATSLLRFIPEHGRATGAATIIAEMGATVQHDINIIAGRETEDRKIVSNKLVRENE